MELDSDFKKASDELEAKLKAQRNLNPRSSTLGLVGVERCRRTGLPAIINTDSSKRSAGDFLDEASYAKEMAFNQKSLCIKSFGLDTLTYSQIPKHVSEMQWYNSWVAVIHADGNGLGQVVRKVGSDRDVFRKFSIDLDKATEKSANEAYESVKNMFNAKEKEKEKEKELIPIRPIVLGGDDLTVICRADLAIPYVTQFLKSFEQNTKGIVKRGVFADEPYQTGLTACAGVAFIKSSYPFHYGYNLAESLCSAAKKDAKDTEAIRNGNALPKSCLCFHRVQGSFTDDYDTIIKRELTPNAHLRFDFGPYYVNEKTGRWTISHLQDAVENLSKDKSGSVRTHIRRWISEMYNNPEKAEQMLKRAINVTGKKEIITELTNGVQRGNGSDSIVVCPAYDVLSLYSIIYKN